MPRTETRFSTSGLPFWPEKLVSPEGAFGDLMKNTQAAMQSNYRTISDETLQFINKRLAHNSESIEQCRNCDDVGTLMMAQQKWMMDLAHDYYDEAVRIGELTGKMFADGFASDKPGADRPRAEKRTQA